MSGCVNGSYFKSDSSLLLSSTLINDEPLLIFPWVISLTLTVKGVYIFIMQHISGKAHANKY